MSGEEIAKNPENDLEINEPAAVADEEHGFTTEEAAIETPAHMLTSSPMDTNTEPEPVTTTTLAELDQDDKHALFT